MEVQTRISTHWMGLNTTLTCDSRVNNIQLSQCLVQRSILHSPSPKPASPTAPSFIRLPHSPLECLLNIAAALPRLQCGAQDCSIGCSHSFRELSEGSRISTNWAVSKTLQSSNTFNPPQNWDALMRLVKSMSQLNGCSPRSLPRELLGLLRTFPSDLLDLSASGRRPWLCHGRRPWFCVINGRLKGSTMEETNSESAGHHYASSLALRERRSPMITCT